MAQAYPVLQVVDGAGMKAEIDAMQRSKVEAEQKEAKAKVEEENKDIYSAGADGHYQVSEYKSEYETSEYKTSDYQCSDYKSVYEK
jgi:hypothetical protein